MCVCVWQGVVVYFPKCTIVQSNRDFGRVSIVFQ